MKTAAACVGALLLSAGVGACPMSKALVERYGISDGGFVSPPPVARPSANPAFLRISLPKSSLVSDGFGYTFFVDRQAGQAWLHRTGGLAGVSEWYGPIDVGMVSLEGCRDDKEVRRQEAIESAAARPGPTPRAVTVRLTP